MKNLLGRSNTSITGFIAAVLMVCLSNGFAKSYNWDNISQQQYIDNLVSCETQLQEYRWSKNIWPKVNKTPKPAFSSVLDVDKIRQKVLNNLCKQNILSTQFNIEINQAILQHDLDRMAANTKDANGLKAMYELFDNDAATIAQCISRPNLVNQKTQNSYDWNYETHQATQEIAKSELQIYLATQSTQELLAQVNTITFKLKDDSPKSFELNNTGNQENIIELVKQEFKLKVRQLNNSQFNDYVEDLSVDFKVDNSIPNLQQKDHAFIYTEILEQNDDSIKVKNLVWQKQGLNQWLETQEKTIPSQQSIDKKLALTKISSSKVFNKAGVTADTWASTSTTSAPSARQYHTAIWSGNEMIVWGGQDDNGDIINTGGRYNPSTDSWTATNTIAPRVRQHHTSIWSGSEMVVWGGEDDNGTRLNTGGRYDPSSNSWSATSTTSAPNARRYHTAIWSGSEMIVWGGNTISSGFSNTGGRYDPSSDSWSATSTSLAPSVRRLHTAIWSGNEMIIWGGFGGSLVNTGGRYNPSSDSWIETSTNFAPTSRALHTAIWSGSEMIVWGGGGTNTGGRYDPSSDSWIATSTTSAPSARSDHTAIWSGSEMIVWGGGGTNTGGRYDPIGDSWSTTSTTSAPSARQYHTAIWNGSEMIVWGGQDFLPLNTGGVYYPSNSYTISGVLTGLLGDQVILQNNGGDDLTLTSDGGFTFANAILEGDSYDVMVLTDPNTPNQTCSVSNGTGTNIMADVSNVVVDCMTTTYTIGITISGLGAGNVILQNNAGDDLNIATDGSYTFATQLDDLSNYAVTVLAQPSAPSQTCTVTGGDNNDGTGMLSAADDLSIVVTCVTNQYSVGVTVSGLGAGNVILQNNSNDFLNIATDGNYVFNDQLEDLSTYAVFVLVNPTTPSQTCTVTGGDNNDGTGALSGADDLSIVVSCLFDTDLIFKNGFE